MSKGGSQTTLELTRNLNISLFHKLILLSINTRCLPDIFITLAFTWSQFQLLILFARVVILCLFEDQTSTALHPVIMIEKYLFSGDLFDEIEHPRTAPVTLSLALIYLMIITLIMVYISSALNRGFSPQSFALKTWNAFTDLHVLVAFFPLHFNSVKLVLNFSAGKSIKIFALIVLIYNLILTLSSVILCYTSLKTKHPLSSKINSVNIAELLVKSALPFLICSEDQSISQIGKVLLMIFVPLYCFYRDYILLKILPYYRLKTLKIASEAHAIITSMILAGIFGRLFWKIHADWNQYRVIVLLWIVFGLAFIKIYKSYLERKLLKIIQSPEQIKNPYEIIHYWEIYKSYSRYRSSEFSRPRITQKYFDFLSITGGLNHEEEEENKMEKKIYYEKNIELLKDFISKYPGDSWLVELALANIYAKKESSCALAAHLVTDHTNKHFFETTSLLIIKLKILNKLKSRKIDDGSEALQITNFIHMQDKYKKLRKEMIRNVDYHVRFWRVFSSAKPSLVKMISFAKKNITSSKDLKSIFNQCKDFKKVSYSEPLLACSIYCYFFQDDTLLAGTLLKEYFSTEEKVEELNEKSQDDLMRFTTEALHLIVSSQQNKLGVILECSGPISSVFGYPKDLLIGKSINLLISPLYAEHYNYLMKTYSSGDKFSKNILNKTRPIVMLVREGYVSPGIIHMSLNYTEGFELCYNVFLECVKDDRRLVILNENGGISGCSENFAKDLGFKGYKDKDLLNIKDFCGESLSKIMAKFEGQNHKESDEVESLISTIYEKEIELLFAPFWSNNKESEPIKYSAKVKKLDVQNTEMLEIQLHKLSSFSFTPPPGLLEPHSRLKRPTTRNHPPPMFRIDSEVPPMSPDSPRRGTHKYQTLSQKTSFQTIQTQEVALLSPKSASQRLLSPLNSPKLEKNFEFSVYTVETADAPIMKREVPSGHQQTPLNGDEDSEIDQREEGEIMNHEVFPYNQEGPNKEELLEDIFENSSIESGNTKLENAKFIRRQKTIKRLVHDRTHRTETKFYIASFAITCLVLLTLLIWLNFFASTSSQNVTIYSNALQNAYFRSYWTKIANQDTLYWLGALVGWVDYDPNILTDGFDNSFHHASYYNQMLEESISFITPELQEMHYEKNVRIYDRDVNFDKRFAGYDDTFQATKRIVDRGMTNYIQATSGFDFQEKINQDTYFIFDNALNDLQIQEMRLILAIKDHLFGIFSTSRETMLQYMGVVFGIVFFFMVFSLKYIITVNINFRKFMYILYTLKKPEVKHIEDVSLNFKELLEKDYQEKELFFNLYDVEKAQVASQKAQIRENQTRYVKKQQQRENYFAPDLQGSLKEVYSRNLLLFSGLFVFTALTVGFVFVYYSQSSDKLNTMQRQQININSALDFVNSLSWITTEIHLLALFNFTLPTRNILIAESIMTDIDQLKDVTILQNSLRNEHEAFSPEMQAILFNFSCSDAYSPYYSYPLDVLEPECQNISNGDNSIGLLDLSTRLSMTLSADIPALYSGPKDLEALIAYENDCFWIYGYMIDNLFVLLLSAYALGTEEFQSLIEDLKVLQVKLAGIAVTFSFLLGVVTWVFIMRKISKLDFESKEILSFIPTRLLVKNSQLKRYLVRTARADDTAAQSLLK